MADKPKTKFALGDYVEVSERIAAWFEAYPDGRIETDIVSMTDKMVVTKSRCYRTDESNEQPAGIGHSMLAIPGATPYTKGSELENCETSSVGRALVMAGIPSKNIASGHEIRNKRQDEPKPEPAKRGTPQKPELTAEQQAKVAELQQEINRANTIDAMNGLREILKEQCELVKTAVRPLFATRLALIEPQQA
jgi:hypothetical protein